MNSELRDAIRNLEMVSVTIDGRESFLSDALSKIGSGIVKEGAKAVAGFAVEKTVSGLKSLNTSLIKTLGTRRMLLSNLLSRASKGESKDEITFTGTILKNYTTNGKPSGLVHGVETAVDMFKDVLQYAKDLEAYYNKELVLIQGITSLKNTQDVTEMLGKFDALKYPVPKGGDDRSAEEVTWFLPGSRAITYTTGSHKFSFSTREHETTVEDTTESFAQSEFKELIKKLNELVSIYKGVSDANDHYAEYLKKYNTVVGKASEHLSSLRGEVSASLLNDLGSRIEGNTLLFTFYTGFLAKVMIYLDDYVETLSSHLSKQFN